MYALSVGKINGDLFTHLIAVAPGYIRAPAPPVGKPRIFLAHGTRDNVSACQEPDAAAAAVATGRLRRHLLRVRRPGLHDASAARAALNWLVG